MIIPGAQAVSDLPDAAPTVDDATYNLRVAKSEYVAIPKTKDAKGPYVKVGFVITGPGEVKGLGRWIFMNYSLTGDGAWRIKEFLKAAGFPDDFVLTDDQDLMNREISAMVITKPGTGGYGPKNEIRKHLSLIAA